MRERLLVAGVAGARGVRREGARVRSSGLEPVTPWHAGPVRSAAHISCCHQTLDTCWGIGLPAMQARP
jgi:hypothetical protein